ncbi:hypothetical protein [Helicobacter cinaedi]|nr:hypothetical protein [Helicobacter cinaedi]
MKVIYILFASTLESARIIQKSLIPFMNMKTILLFMGHLQF